MTKALFFDVDGTLVSFNTHRIPASTLDALAAAKAAGTKLFIATGRPRQLLDNIADAEPLMDGYILATGAMCVYGGRTVSEHLIPQDEARAVVDFCRERHLSAVVIGRQDVQIVNRDDKFEHIFRDMLNVTYNKFDVPMDEVLAQGVLQITPFLTETEESIILPHLHGCTSARWYPAFCDIISREADKAKGIADIAACLGIDISETMAFGDGGNDLSMLRAAGTGVAMGNAVEQVKAHADYITATVDDDGISRALKHFGIIK